VRVYSWREGLISAGMMSVFLFPVYYGQEARPYGMLLLFALIATYFWTYLADAVTGRERPGGWHIAGYVIFAILTAYWHYFGLLLIGLEGVGLFLLALPKLRTTGQVLLIYVPIVLSYVPWVPTMWRQLHNPNISHPKPVGNIFEVFYTYLSSIYNFGEPQNPFTRAVTFAMLLLYVVAGCAGLWAIYRGRSERGAWRGVLLRGAFVGVWLLGPFLFAYVKSLSSASIYTERNLIVSLPIAYLLAARGLQVACVKPPVQVGVVALILAAVLLRLLSSTYYSVPHKDQFREAVSLIIKNEKAHPDTLIMGYGYNMCEYNYYFKRFGSKRRIKQRTGSVEDIPRVRKLLAKSHARYWWYLVTDPYPDKKFMTFLAKHFTVAGQKKFYHVQVFLLQRRGASG